MTSKLTDKYQGGSRGFTLVEVLVAMTVFAVAVLGIAALQVTSVRGNSSSRLHTEVTAMAASRVEILRDLPYASVAGGNMASPPSPLTSVAWTVLESNSGSPDAYKTVRVTVSWLDRGQSRNYSIEFIKADDT